MSILTSGAAGFLRSHAVKRLPFADAELSMLYNLSTGNAHAAVRSKG